MGTWLNLDLHSQEGQQHHAIRSEAKKLSKDYQMQKVVTIHSFDYSYISTWSISCVIRRITDGMPGFEQEYKDP
jgi:hypothetical protein